MPFPVSYLCAATSQTGRVGGSVTYERTAFLSSSGNDGTASLNNPALPYLTTDAALVALVAAHPGEDTTLRLLDDFNGGAAFIGDAASVGVSANLTIKAHGATFRTLNGALTCADRTIDLRLDNVAIDTLTWEDNAATQSTAAGTVTALTESSVASATAQGYTPPQ